MRRAVFRVYNLLWPKVAQLGTKVDPVDAQPAKPAVDAPLGMYNGKLDDKGRLKLPAPFQEFLSSLPEKRLFVTSIDRRTAQIYPIANWRENQKLLSSRREDKQAAKILLFNAQDLGADGEMDNQGRITVNNELRQRLDLDGHALRLFWNDGHLRILTEAVYQSQLRTAMEQTDAAVASMEGAGLQ